MPFRYKKNLINGELRRTKKIALNFQSETARVKTKFLKVGFPRKVVENTITNFKNAGEELMILRWFFDERITVVMKIEKFIKNLLQKFRLSYKC